MIVNFLFFYGTATFSSDLGDSYDPTPRHKYRMKKYKKMPASVDSHKLLTQPARHRGQTMDGHPP